jgi:O-acetyl-ADP-ribose deacetylase (regulator of RNase III)
MATYGHPQPKAAQVAAAAVCDCLERKPATFDLIVSCCFSAEATQIYEAEIEEHRTSAQ